MGYPLSFHKDYHRCMLETPFFLSLPHHPFLSSLFFDFVQGYLHLIDPLNLLFIYALDQRQVIQSSGAKFETSFRVYFR